MMPTPQIDFNDFIMVQFEQAIREFHKTEQYRLLNEKIGQLTNDCKVNFNASDYEYIKACIDALVESNERKTEFIYRQAYKDCVALLKKLEILN